MEMNTNVYNEYIASLFAPQDSALTEAIAEMKRENIPEINVSATEGKLLQVLALTVGAKRILEIGTLGGYSAIHLARALPDDGKLLTLEIDPHHAEVARCNFQRAGVDHKVEIHVGPAAETLRRLTAGNEPLFDLIFIDADKEGYPQYLALSLPLTRDGGLILADNTLSHGALDPQANTGITLYNTTVSAHPDLVSIIVPVLRGRGGIDGLLISIKRPNLQTNTRNGLQDNPGLRPLTS